MASREIDPSDFCHVGTRRVDSFAAAARAPIVAGAGLDGRVYVWNVRARERVREFPTIADSGGVSLALDAGGGRCFVGTYYAWGVGCIDLSIGDQIWHRTDLKRVQGMCVVPDDASVVVWFENAAGLTLDARTGDTRERHVGLRAFQASRLDRATLKYARQFELTDAGGHRHKWPRDRFALLAASFSSELCLVSESTAAVKAVALSSGRPVWTYEPRPGAHLLALDYATESAQFVGLEYAYSGAARETGPMVALLHLDSSGNVTFRRALRDWSTAVFCADAELLLNGLGELHDVRSGDVTHVFDVPR